MIEAAPRVGTAGAGFESAGRRARQGRRAITTDSRGGLRQWHGGRLGRLVSWDGPGKNTAARPDGAIGRSSNSWMIAVCSRRALRSMLAEHARRHAIVARGDALVSTPSRSAMHGAKSWHSMASHHGRAARTWSSGPPARSRPARPRPTTRSSAPPPARSAYNVDGTGMTVAVIDTGVDYNNPALGGGFGPGAQGHRRLRFRRQHRPIRWPPPRSTAPPSPA